MPRLITVPFSRLIFLYREIGYHRGRRWGFGAIFGYPTLNNLPFLRLADKVKRAYEGRRVPSHQGWPAQQEALKWFVDRGQDGIYALDMAAIEVQPAQGSNVYIVDGHHRALALHILGASEIKAAVTSRSRTRGRFVLKRVF